MENHIQSVTIVEGKKRKTEDATQCDENPKKASQSVENEKQCGKNPKDTILGVENERQGIMQSKSQQRVLRFGPSLLQHRNAVTVRKG